MISLCRIPRLLKSLRCSLAVSRNIVKTAKNYLRNCTPRGRRESAGVVIAELQLTKKNPIRSKLKQNAKGNKLTRGQETNAASRLIRLTGKKMTSLAISMIVLSILISRFHAGETDFTTKCKYVLP